MFSQKDKDFECVAISLSNQVLMCLALRSQRGESPMK